jgi:DNA-binding winged helix-turn-helix (wHTH) protein
MSGRHEVLRFGPFIRDRKEGCLTTGGERVPLTRQALAVLDVLLDAAGELVSKETLIAEAWSRQYITDDALSKRLHELRRALGDDARRPRYIETVQRLGFRFVGRVEQTLADAGQLLGRATELAQLMRWRREVERNHPLMISISGEPGIGKSRLLETFLASGGDSASLLRGHCGAQSQLQPFMPILTALIDGLRQGDDLRAALMSFAPTWARAIPELDDSADSMPAHSQQRLLLELCTALDHAARVRPLILAIEDIHWADASTLALLDYLARRRIQSALMVLVTFREQGLAASTEAGHLLANLVGRDSMRALVLAPFDGPTVAQWMRQEFGAQGDEMAPLMYQHSLGLPLYLNWLIQDCRSRMSETGAIDTDTLQRTLPVSLGRLFQIQLSSLSGSDRQVVDAGAVIGTPFMPAFIAALTNQSEHEVEDTLRKLLATGQLVHRTDLLNRSYQLAHELLRQAVYDAVDETRRADLHSRYANVLIATSNVDHSVLAHHFTRAKRWTEAIEAHVAAANTAQGSHAALECIDHLEAAIDLSRRYAVFPPRDDWLYTLHENLYGIYRTTHGYTRPRVHDLVNEIADLGGTSANPKIRCKSLSVQIGHAMMCGRVPWGLARSAELDRRAAELGEPGRLVEANSLLGEANLYAGNLREAMQRLIVCQDLLAAMPEPKGARWNSGVHRLLALVQVELGQFSAACVSVEQGLAEAATPYQQAMCLYNGYSVHALHGDFAGGEPYVARLESIVRQYDFMEIEIWASLTRAMVMVETGNPETALRLTLDGRRLLEERGTNLFRGLVHMAEGRARARLGDAEGAYRTLNQGIEISQRQGEFGCLANVLFTRGEIGLWLDRPEAHDDLVAAFEQARRNGSLLWQVRDLAFLATVDRSRLPALKKLLRRIDAVPVDVRRIASQLGLELS